MKLHHINIKAPQELLRQERDFFCAVLELREGNRPNFSTHGYWLYADGEAIVHLSESDSHCQNEKQGYFDHVAFQTNNLKQIIQNLDDRQVDYSTVYLPEIRMTQLFLRAPSGTGIEINFTAERACA